MTGCLILIFLLFWQISAGWGLLTLFKLELKPALILPLSVLLGIAVFAAVPFIMQLFYIPLTAANLFTNLFLTTLLVNIRCARGFQQLKIDLKSSSFKIAVYEWPFLLIIGAIIFVSVWRCFYFPPTPSDITTGAEAIATYAVKEKTMINSVFSVTQNGNALKPAFITGLQIIYKYAGFPFGQVWLSNVFVSFIVLLYHLLNTTLHKVISGLLLIAFLAIPEMYAYTFMILYDYSNAVYFLLAVFFMLQYFRNRRLSDIAFAGLLLGIATFLRPEILLLTIALLPVVWYHNYKNKTVFIKAIKAYSIFILPTILIYIVTVYIYINHYLPGHYKVADQLNPALLNWKGIWHQFIEANTQIIFSNYGVEIYGYYIFIFLGLLLLELIIKRKVTATAKNYLYAILLIYLFYPLLSHVLPGVSIENTVKRAFFKMFPLMLLYMANNQLLIGLSDRITGWEFKKEG